MPDGSMRAGALFARLFTGVAGRVLVALVSLAVLAGVLTVPENRARLMSAAGIEQGLKTDAGPVVKVGRGSPGRAPVLGHHPDWKPRPVRVPASGSAQVTPGARFVAAGSLPVAVADPVAAEAVLAPAVKAAQRQAAVQRAWTPQVAVAARRAALTPEGQPLSAGSVGELWLKAAQRAPGRDVTRPDPTPANPDLGSRRTVRGPAVAQGPVERALAAVESASAVASAASPAGVPAGEGARVPAPAAGGPDVAGAGGPVRVVALSQAEVERVHGQFVGFRVERAGGGNAPVAVSVDYSGFTDAAGGGFGGRLGLVAYPGCVLTTPEVPECQVATPVVSVNNVETKQVIAVVTPAGPAASPSAIASPSPSPTAAPSPSPTAAPSPSPAASPSAVASPSAAAGVSPSASAPAAAVETASASPAGSSSAGSAEGSVDLTGHTQAAAYHAAAVPDAAVPAAGVPAAGVPAAGVRGAGVRAAVSVSAAVFALQAGPSSGAGSYTATGLQASMKWDLGLQNGNFGYGIDLPFVPAPAGDTPAVGLRYASSDVDGMVSVENPQGGEAGAGWSLNTPFIERRYKPCSDGSGNLCWSGDNATLKLEGQSSSLHLTGFAGGGTKVWKMTDDQGWKVEQVQPGNSVNNNGDANGEYWKVTSTDGTQYFFGREDPAWGPATHSTMRLPLYGQASGDTCWAQANHMCFKAWRWNLAYVLDADGNLQRYTWNKDRAAYATQQGAIRSPQVYDLNSQLVAVEYGFTAATATAAAPARTVLAYQWRCDLADPGQCQGPAVAAERGRYPDVPFDQWCPEGASSCPAAVRTPVFFSFRKLGQVTSQRRAGDGYQEVEQVRLSYGFPDDDGMAVPTLFLKEVTRTGLDGTRTELPPVQFQEAFYPNRWAPRAGEPDLDKPRISVIKNEFGGLVKVIYWQPDDCGAEELSERTVATQTSNCYPRRDGSGAVAWYRKWLATKIVQEDAYGAPAQTTEYVMDRKEGGGQGAAWHSDDDPLTPAAEQLWGDFRGYRKVNVYHGTGTGKTRQEYRLFRGMSGDYRGNNGIQQVTLYTAESSDPATSRRGFVDQPWLNGKVFEHRVLRADGSELSSEQTTYDSHRVANGIPGPYNIHHHPVVQVGVETTTTMTAKGGTPRALKHTVRHAYDHVWGRELWTQDDGDPVTGIGPSCDYTVYGGWNGSEFVPDTNTWIIEAPRQELSTAAACPTNPTSVPTTDLIGRQDLYYGDNWADLTSSPNTSNVTKTVDYSAAGTPFAVTATKYDARGRVVAEIAPDNYQTDGTSFDTAGTAHTTGYTETNGLVTATVHTNEAGHVTTTVTDPGTQLPVTVTDPNGRVTTSRYDALGRLLGVRLPGDDFEAKTFTYTVSNTAPSVVRTDAYPAKDAAPITSWAFLDSLGRSFQSQTVSPSGGQIVSGTRYDQRGNPAASVAAFYVEGGTAGAVVPNWYTPAFTDTLPSTTVTGYDDLDRPVTSTLIGPGTRFTTTTSYDGLSTTTTPPSNTGHSEPDLAPTTVTTDVYGNTVTQTRAGVTTRYGYDIAGNLTTITSPAGKVTRYEYDWLTRRTSTVEPDTGTSTADYYPSGTLKHTRDANGADLYTAIDVLGRPVATYEGTSTSGTKLTETTYDGTPLGAASPVKGIVTARTRYNDGHAYTETYGYDSRYHVTRTDQTIPAVAGSPVQHLAGTYTTTATFDGLGRATSLTYPAAGGLPAETVTTGYNGAYPTTLTSPLGTYVAQTAYTGTGQLASRILGVNGATGSVKRTYSYDPATLALTNQTAATPSTQATANVQNDTYRYTPTGQTSKITDGVAGQQQCYTYDPLNRLVAAFTSTTADAAGGQAGNACTPDTTGPAPYHQTYSYDDDGNLTTLTSGGVASTYGYGTNTSLGVTGGPHAPTTVTKNGKTVSYSYDARGQLIRRVDGDTTTTYTWNAQGRLTQLTEGGKTSTFTDGPDGDRWIRATPTETVAYLAGQELHLKTGQTTPTAVRYYTHAGATIAARTSGTGGGLSWMLGDRQGSATVAVNNDTAAVSRDRYLPYGGNRDTNQLWTLPTDRGWLGQIQDKETGLDYLNARYYDPTLAHFISTDPLNDTRSPQAANPYAYAADNPITYSDPSGLLSATYQYYTVRKGDNWNTISKRFNLSFNQLRPLNGGSLMAVHVNQRVVVGVTYGPDKYNTKQPLPPKKTQPKTQPAKKSTAEGGWTRPTSLVEQFKNFGRYGTPLSPPPAALEIDRNTPSCRYLHICLTYAEESALGVAAMVVPGGKGAPGKGSVASGSSAKTFLNRHGQLTNGRYTVDETGMVPHVTGSTTSGKSQFLSGVDADKAVLDAALYADSKGLWVGNKAKVFVENGPVGISGRTGELTHWLNIYRTRTGFVHGAPGGAP